LPLDHPATLATRAIGAADPRERLRAISALRSELDDLESQAVRGAIKGGASWSQVAEALGVSKQSAHRRYARRLDEPTPLPRRRPIEPAENRILVTPRARRAVRAARAAARALDHTAVDPGHLLLGLMADTSGVAAHALSAIGVDFDAAREAVARLGLPATPAGASDKRRVPIGAAARDALEQSLREARRLGHEHLGVEHILLGLLRDDEGGAVRVLGDVGIAPDDLERCVGKVLMESSFERS
jgi:hypothetical protein